MSKLLINEHPLQALPSLAVALGKSIERAIILQQIHYWTIHPSAPAKDGRKWHYATYEGWQKQFPWISDTTLGRHMRWLEDNGFLITCQPNKHKGDKTKWYSLNYEAIEALCQKDVSKESTHNVKMNDAPPHSVKMNDHNVKMTFSSTREEETTKETKEAATHARARSSLNTKEIDPAKASAAEADKKEKKDYAMARLAELHRGEQAKLKGRPRAKPEGEFRYEPAVIHPITDDDKPLSDELYDEGVSKGCILALFRAYPNRAHIRQSLKKLKHAIKTKGVKSPDGFMRHVMNDPYEEVRVGKMAPKEAPRANTSVTETQKIITSRVEADKIKERLISNPVALQSKMSGLWDALKRGRAVALTAH